MIANTVQLRALVREAKLKPCYQYTNKYNGTKTDPKKRIYRISCSDYALTKISQLMDEHQYTNSTWLTCAFHDFSSGFTYMNFETHLPD